MEKGIDGTVDVKFQDNVAIITFNCGQNRLNSSFIRKFNKALDQVESNEDVHALITTSTGKFYSNGIDVEWLMNRTNTDHEHFIYDEFPSLLLRLLTFPVLTMAAINGHAFAGGALISFCHDYRVMQTKKGWIAMNEVHINMLFTDFLSNVLRAKLPSGQVFHECITLGKTYTADEAMKAGLIDVTCSAEELMDAAKLQIKRTIPKGPYNRNSLKNMKTDIYKHLFEDKEKALLKSKM